MLFGQSRRLLWFYLHQRGNIQCYVLTVVRICQNKILSNFNTVDVDSPDHTASHDDVTWPITWRQWQKQDSLNEIKIWHEIKWRLYFPEAIREAPICTFTAFEWAANYWTHLTGCLQFFQEYQFIIKTLLEFVIICEVLLRQSHNMKPPLVSIHKHT